MTIRYVSIPFKREGIYKGFKMNIRRPSIVKPVSIPFKREGIYKAMYVYLAIDVDGVSIPFKREGIYKDRKRTLYTYWF